MYLAAAHGQGAAIGLVLYALIELTEDVGLWLGQRWGEYFAIVATSVFLPYEVYDLTVKVTWLRVEVEQGALAAAAPDNAGSTPR